MTRKHPQGEQCSILKPSPLTTSCKRCCGCDCGSEARRCHSVATKHIHFVLDEDVKMWDNELMQKRTHSPGNFPEELTRSTSFLNFLYQREHRPLCKVWRRIFECVARSVQILQVLARTGETQLCYWYTILPILQVMRCGYWSTNTQYSLPGTCTNTISQFDNPFACMHVHTINHPTSRSTRFHNEQRGNEVWTRRPRGPRYCQISSVLSVQGHWSFLRYRWFPLLSTYLSAHCWHLCWPIRRDRHWCGCRVSC